MDVMVYLIRGLLTPTFSSQVDQLRSELMQERSARHDLEMDKSALERQVLLGSSTSCRCTQVHTHTHTVRTDLFTFTVPLPLPAEGVEVSCGRHGGTDSAVSWNQPAGKQNPGVGGETAQ